MEAQQVKMYSDYKSPFAYLAFEPAFALQDQYHVRLRWIPFQLRIKGKGERSVYSEYKVKYSYLDARRWAKPRGIYIKGPKKIYDTTPALIGAACLPIGVGVSWITAARSTSASFAGNWRPIRLRQSPKSLASWNYLPMNT